MIRHLKEQMNEAASALDFEAAEEFRKKAASLEKHYGKSLIVSSVIGSIDVFSLVFDTNEAYGNFMRLRDGAVIQSLNLGFRMNIEEERSSVLGMFIGEIRSKFGDLSREAIVPFRPDVEIDGVEIACVSGSFPSSQALIEVKVAETALAVKDGATEIDIVMPVGKFLSGDYEGVCDDIGELKQACGDAPMKVILETGCLKTASNIKKASILAMYAGADYIKTSTGKLEPAATPEAAYVMCQAIKEYYEETGIQIGFKPAGGLNSVMDAIIYYTIVKEVLGEKWLTNKWLRLGTSRLANMLLSEITGEETKFF